MKYIKNEAVVDRLISSSWWVNTSVNSQAIFVFDINPGSYSVNISCEGQQSVDHVGGATEGHWLGLIAYGNQSDDNWGVGVYSNCTITKYINTATWRPGHKDLELNGCRFNDGQIVERDAVMSFHVAASNQARFYLAAPKTQKADKYNYVVSYGGYTDKTMEFGTITVTIDEQDDEARRVERHVESLQRIGHVQLAHEWGTLLPLGSTLQLSNNYIDSVSKEPEVLAAPSVRESLVSDTDSDSEERKVIKEQVEKVFPTSEQIAEYEKASSEIPDFTVSTEGDVDFEPPKPPHMQPIPGYKVGLTKPPVYRTDQITVPNVQVTNKPKNAGFSKLFSRSRSPDASSTVSNSRLSGEEWRTYYRIEREQGKTAALRYKASLVNDQQL